MTPDETTTNGSATYWLWEQAQEIERSIERLSEDIERLEREIVKQRDKRDRLRLVRAEMLAAAGFLERSWFKVERQGSEVVVSFEPEAQP